MSIIRNICTDVEAIRTIHSARKRGCEVTLKVCAPLPAVQKNSKPSLWAWTMESTLFTGELGRAIYEVFRQFDEPTQHALTFAPKAGEWPARLQFWADALRNTLSPEQFTAAIETLSKHRARVTA